jgi:hypothetical protein
MPKPAEPEVESTGPNQWEVAAHAVPGEQDWVYHARKNANDGKGDAVANQLEYKPVCTHMPVCKEQCSDATFLWTKKKAASHH